MSIFDGKWLFSVGAAVKLPLFFSFTGRHIQLREFKKN